MSTLTKEDVLELIRASSFSPLVPSAGENGKLPDPDHLREKSAVDDLHRMVSNKVISLQLVDALVEASRSVALQAITDLLKSVPNNRPLDAINLGRIENVLQVVSDSLNKKNVSSSVSIIRTEHQRAVSEIPFVVTRKIASAIRGAMGARQLAHGGLAS